MSIIVHGPDKILVTSGWAKDLKYQLVGRINVNKILHDNPTKRVAYMAFLFCISHLQDFKVNSMCDGYVHFWQKLVYWYMAISNLM